MAVPGRKTVLSSVTFRTRVPIGGAVIMLFFLLFSRPLSGQFTDPLNAYPPRWSLDENDCDARVTEQGHAHDATAEGGRCETITMLTSHGTKALLVYPIEPVRPLDALVASVSVKGLSRGIQIGVRVRFPYLIDPLTKRPASLLVYGSSYRRIGEFQRLGVSDIEGDLRLKRVSLRNQFGAQADVSSPYVDAVVLNAYGGPGNHTLRMDSLKIEGMVPLLEEVAGVPASIDATAPEVDLDPHRRHGGASLHDSRRHTVDTSRSGGRSLASPFPSGRVTRILQYNGEPLSWVRSLGFDSVWLSRPPSGSILSEAIAARMTIYAPAPSSPDEKLAPLLEPVAGWIVGGDRTMDSENESFHGEAVARLRRLPTRWQRPLVGCPVESFREYAALLDGVILDAPPRVRNLSSGETKAQRRGQRVRINGRPLAIAVAGMANEVASSQTDAIATRIGTPPRDTFRWHGMWRQVADALGDRPDAILIRSSRPLSGGTPRQQSRAMSLSFVNRFVASLQPWVSAAAADSDSELIYETGTQRPLYFAHRLSVGATTLLLISTAMHRGDSVLAGDGKSIDIQLPPADEGKLIWRLTHFSAERVTPKTDSTGTVVRIVSPDVVEAIVISDDLGEGGRLNRSATRYARQAAMDRWQLTNEALVRSEANWSGAMAARVVSRTAPTDLLGVARASLAEAEQRARSGQSQASLRMSRRADAWCAKSDWMLREALLQGVHPQGEPSRTAPPDGSSARHAISSPPLIAGDFETQIAWSPLLKTPVHRLETLPPSVVNQAGGRSRWGANHIAGGDFERATSRPGDDVLSREGWTLGRRHRKWADAEARLVNRGAFSGTGALRLRVTPEDRDSLPGGYEGTCLMVRSPVVRIQEAGVVRIDAVVRTLGFSGPHQGLLIYDSVGTQEMGVLIRDQPSWTPVTLIRQVPADTSINVMMELIGGGEAMIDDIQVRFWETVPNPSSQMRRISTAPANQSAESAATGDL